MPRLTPPQMVYFMPGIVAFAAHPAPKCRETMYDILFWVYDNYRYCTFVFSFCCYFHVANSLSIVIINRSLVNMCWLLDI